MPTAAENLKPASNRLREDFLTRLATLMQTAPASTPLSRYTPRRLTVPLGREDVPTFLLDRLPPEYSPPYTYELRANDRRPNSLRASSLSFVGSLTVSRIMTLFGPNDTELHWSVQYDINSLRRRIGRHVVGAEVHTSNPNLNQPLQLPDTPLTPFPVKLAVTEAEQLTVMVDRCGDLYRATLGSGSSEN